MQRPGAGLTIRATCDASVTIHTSCVATSRGARPMSLPAKHCGGSTLATEVRVKLRPQWLEVEQAAPGRPQPSAWRSEPRSLITRHSITRIILKTANNDSATAVDAARCPPAGRISHTKSTPYRRRPRTASGSPKTLGQNFCHSHVCDTPRPPK